MTCSATCFIHLTMCLWSVHTDASRSDFFSFHYYVAGIHHLNDFTTFYLVNTLLIDI